MSHYLVLSAVGEDKPGIVHAVAAAAHQQQCSILDSRMTVLGGEFALITLIQGPVDALAQLQQALSELEHSHGLTLVFKHTQQRPHNQQSHAYRISVTAMDHPGIVDNISAYLSQHQVNIEDLQTQVYPAPHSGTPMFKLVMQVQIPGHNLHAQFQDDFTDYCDARNLDADIHPIDS